MKIIFSIFLLAGIAHAQTDTVINVNNGQKLENTSKFEIVDGTDDIQGDTAPLKKTAQDNWKKACSQWTKDFKAENKEGVLAASCGKMKCAKEGVETTCTSEAKYKLRVLKEQSKQ
jgi:hypothetical protein